MAAQPTPNFAFAPLPFPLLTPPSFTAVPMYSAPLPVAMTLPPIMSPLLTLAPENSVPMFFDESSQTLTSIPANLVQINSQNQYEAPAGYSFVPLSAVSSLTSSAPSLSVTSDQEPAEPQQTQSARSDSGDEQQQQQPAKRKKYPHRSKQIRILEVHASLKEEYTARGLYADEDEVLRGEDTVRAHVKTFQGLNKIKDVLDEVHKADVTVRRIATPFSMKNKFQKKGFIVYLKLASPSEVPAVQAVFAKYSEHFKKCDVALPKEKPTSTLPPLKSQLSAAGFSEKENSWADADLFMATPPPLMRHNSHEMAA